jgi:lipopolysaccharide transport system permease protein
MTTGNSASTLGAVAGEAAVSSTRVAPPHTLPDKPLVTIEPSRSWTALNLRDLWAYRELLYFLTWRDVKVRYKQTVLGVAWVVLQPLLTTLVFTIFLGVLVRVPSDGFPYALFVYAGMIPWSFFTSSVYSTSNSLVGNSHLITKVYFPRSIIPLAAVAARLPDFVISFVVLIGMMLHYHVPATWGLLMLPPCVAVVSLLALGLGMAASALNVKYRDVGVLVPLLLQLLMYASPVVYPVSLVPPGWRRLYILNPMAGVIEGYRSALLGRAFDWTALAVSAVCAVVLVVCAAYWFRRVEAQFADII